MIVDRVQVAAALPGYELGAQLGTGAFGLVLAARHRGLDRPVAVKVLPAGTGGAAPDFVGEARLLARLDHPHVVRVYDYVEADELCLVVMELLGGGTLTRRQQGMAPEEACAVGLAVAAALSCAHAQGVLHRDIKPDNVLFDTAGLLKVADFGIAKIVEGSAATASAVVGTPTYMAPEQVSGGRLGPATDIYALGAVLYQLLAGTPPFDSTGGVRALWQHHLDTTPAPPAGVPDPVAAVVLRALAKEPGARPSSARAFALDLAEAAADAYGPGWTARSGLVLRLDDDVRAAADHPTTPTLVSPAPLVPQPPAADADGGVDANSDGNAHSDSGGPRPAAEQVDSHPPEKVVDSSATTEGGSPGSAVAHGPQRHSEEHIAEGSDQLTALEDQPTARPPATAAHTGQPTTREPPTPGRTRTLGWPWPRGLSAAVVLLVLAAVTGTVLAVRSGSGQNSADAPGPATSAPQTPVPTPRPRSPRLLGEPLKGHTGGVFSVGFAPTGRTLATVGGDATVRLWDVTEPATPRPLGQPLESHTAPVTSLAFSPDGMILATGGMDTTVRLWDVTEPAAPRPLGQPLKGHTDWVMSVVFAPTGRTLATSSRDATVRLWDVVEPAAPRSLGEPLEGHTGAVTAVAFSPTQDVLATGGDDATVRLWAESDDSATPRAAGTLTGHTGTVWSAVFSPDGRTVATGSDDATLRLWDVADPAAPRPLGTPLASDTGPVTSAVFAPDGRTLATGSKDGTMLLWDVADPAAPRPLGGPLKGHTGTVWWVAFSPTGRTLASASEDGTVRLWAVG